jgi:ComEC/Rec2-related protein
MRNTLVKQQLLGFYRSHFFFLPLLGLLTGYLVFAFLLGSEIAIDYWSVWVWVVPVILLFSTLVWAIIQYRKRKEDSSTWIYRWIRSTIIYLLHVCIGAWVLPPELPSNRLGEVAVEPEFLQGLDSGHFVVVDCVDSVSKEARINGRFWVKITRWRKDSEPWVGPFDRCVMPISVLSEFEFSGIPEDTDWRTIFGSKGYYGRLTWPIKRQEDDQGFRGMVAESDGFRWIGAEGNTGNAWRMDHRDLEIGWKDYLSRNGLFDLRLRCLDWMKTQLHKHLSLKSSSMAIALLIGETREVDSETVKAFGVGGLMHVLAVSGMHVALVMGAILWVITGFGSWPRPNKVSLLVLMVMGWFYAILTGGSAAVVRAMLSASWMWLAKYWVRKRVSSLHVWLGCAYVQLLLQPYSMYNLGFVLSYLAVLSLLIFYPILRDFWLMKTENFRSESRMGRWMSRVVGAKRMDAGWQLLLGSVAMNIAATLFTFPLIMCGFGTFPVWFLPVNLLLVPLFTILLYGALIVLLLGWIPVVGNGLGTVVDRLFSWVLGKLLFVLDLPFSQLFSYDWEWVSACFVFVLIAWISWCLWLEVRFGNRVGTLWLISMGLILATGFWIEQNRVRWVGSNEYFKGKLGGKEFWAYKRKEILVITVRKKEWLGESGGYRERRKDSDSTWLIRWGRTVENRRKWESRLEKSTEKYRIQRGIEVVKVRW